jgi:hypothetical protein
MRSRYDYTMTYFHNKLDPNSRCAILDRVYASYSIRSGLSHTFYPANLCLSDHIPVGIILPSDLLLPKKEKVMLSSIILSNSEEVRDIFDKFLSMDSFSWFEMPIDLFRQLVNFCSKKDKERFSKIMNLREKSEQLRGNKFLLQKASLVEEIRLLSRGIVSDLKQKAACFFDKDRELPTKWFSKLVSWRTTSKFISSLESNGQIITDQKEIRDLVFSHFKSMFTKNPEVSQKSFSDFMKDIPEITTLSRDQNDYLSAQFTSMEVFYYLKSMRNAKAPDCYGVIVECFKVLECHQLESLVDFFNGILLGENFSNEYSRISIVPIPKGNLQSIKSIGDIRPIFILTPFLKSLLEF